MEQISSPVVPVTATDERAPRRRRRGVLAILLGLTVVSLGAGMFSLALFTDQTTVSGSFATGTVDLTTTPVPLTLNVTGMVPGDVVNQSITVANAGTASLRYAMSTVATGTLGTTLTLTVKTIGTSCAVFDGTTVVNAATLNGAAIGSNATGNQAGDRTLAFAASEVLCFRFTLPIGTGNALQNQSTTATFTFDAEQTANNP